jgi:amino-acid N-acetyltransferase
MDREVKFTAPVGDNGTDSDIPIRRARVSDVREILDLVNGFAASNLMLPRGPQYVFENIRDFVVAVDTEAKDKIVACGSLHILWEDLAEVRSLAIHPDFQTHGLGKRIIEYMKEDARSLGIKNLFAFTVTAKFFETLGFELKNREEFPAKVWGECSRCPKYFKCDEVGMILEI